MMYAIPLLLTFGNIFYASQISVDATNAVKGRIGKRNASPLNVRRNLKGSKKKNTSYAVVANPSGGSVSFIPEDGDATLGSYHDVLTVDIEKSQPMYVTAVKDCIWIGDRTTPEMPDRIMMFNPKYYEKIMNPVMLYFDPMKCDGVAHQSANDDYLVASCAKTNSFVVISLDKEKIEKYVSIENLQDGENVHDIVINKHDEVFVTTGGTSDEHIIKFDAMKGVEMKRLNLGPMVDAHLAIKPGDDNILYSPQQKKDKVVLYCQEELLEIQVLDLDNAHGICFSPDGKELYVTDFDGEEDMGKEKLVAIQPISVSRSNDINREAMIKSSDEIADVDGAAHNCAVTDSGMIFVTHSGPTASAVSLFGDMDNEQVMLKGYFRTEEEHTNPFGIAIYEGYIDAFEEMMG